MNQTFLRVSIVLTAMLVPASLAAVVMLKSSWGEERVRIALERAATKAIPGRVVIDRVADLEIFSPLGVVRGTAKSLRVLDAEEAELLQVGGVTAEVDVWGLLRDELYVRSATVSGVELPCELETARPRLALGTRRDAFEPRSMDVRLENVEVVGLYAVATKTDGQKAILGRFSGQLDLFAPRHDPAVKMTLRELRGSLSHPRSIQLQDASGVVDTGAPTVADVQFRAVASGATVSGRARYVPSDEGDPLKVNIERIGGINPGMFGNPLEALGGVGVPAEMLRSLGSGMGAAGPR